MNAGQNYYSDYGSGSSSSSTSSTWLPSEIWSSRPSETQPSLVRPTEQKSTSYQDLVTGKCTLEDIMKEFQMNGSDSPYTPVEDRIWSNRADSLAGMGPSSAYVRQTSWPAPERSPAPRLPRPRSDWLPDSTTQDFNPQEFTTSTPIDELGGSSPASLTEQQVRVLSSLPDAAVCALLTELERRGDLQRRAKRMVSECRFCKNNGERESYYRSHALKDGAGRVLCPVLRAFVCKRCGATGHAAHTNKYCPLSTADERMKSSAMMRSVRMASGRRRTYSQALSVHNNDNYMVFGDTPTSVITDNNSYNTFANTLHTAPLDPMWAALEQKLML